MAYKEQDSVVSADGTLGRVMERIEPPSGGPVVRVEWADGTKNWWDEDDPSISPSDPPKP